MPKPQYVPDMSLYGTDDTLVVAVVQSTVYADRPDTVTVLPLVPKPDEEITARSSVSVKVKAPLPESLVVI